MGDGDQVPCLQGDCLSDSFGKSFYTDNEEVGEDQVSLSYTSTRLKELRRLTIDEDSYKGGGNTRYDELDQLSKKVKIDEDFMDERPCYSIKSLFKVYFEDHVSFIPIHLPEVRYVFLHNDGVVCSSSISQESFLRGANDVVKIGFDSIDCDFSDQLIEKFAQVNGSIFPY